MTNSASDHISVEIRRLGVFYELDVLERLRDYVAEADVIIDVGANVGNHALFFARVMKAGRVVALEPNEDTFHALQHTVSANGLENVMCLRMAASDQDRLVAIEATGDPGSARVTTSSGGTVEAHPLDNVRVPGRVSLIKVDVEGHELPVLLGAKQTLEMHKPIVCLELQTAQDVMQCGGWLAERGYVLIERAGSTPTYIAAPIESPRFARLFLWGWKCLAWYSLGLRHWYYGKIVRSVTKVKDPIEPKPLHSHRSSSRRAGLS